MTTDIVDVEMTQQVSTVFTRKIVQKLPLTLVFAYLAHYEDLVHLLKLLCKGSSLFLDKNLS